MFGDKLKDVLAGEVGPKQEYANKLAQSQCNDNAGSSYDPDYLLNHTFKYHPPSAFQQAS